MNGSRIPGVGGGASGAADGSAGAVPVRRRRVAAAAPVAAAVWTFLAAAGGGRGGDRRRHHLVGEVAEHAARDDTQPDHLRHLFFVDLLETHDSLPRYSVLTASRLRPLAAFVAATAPCAARPAAPATVGAAVGGVTAPAGG